MNIRVAAAALICAALMTSADAGVIFTTSYTAAEGFANAPLRNNANWTGGPNVAVRPGTTGFVRNGLVPSDLPTYNVNGAVASSSASAFRVGDQIKINTYIQFDLPGSRSPQEIARFGFSGSTSSNVLEQGFGLVWYDGPQVNPSTSGFLRFFPDFNDYVFTEDISAANINNSLMIPGRAAGLDVNNALGNGVDVRSNMFDVSYTAEKTGIDQWSVVDLSVINLSRVRNNMFSYDLNLRPLQTFTFDEADAFFGQQLIVRGQGSDDAIARSEYVTYSFLQANPVPEPTTFAVALILSVCGVVPRRRRA